MPIPDLLPALTSRLRAELRAVAGSPATGPGHGPQRTIAILGVGSELRSDDAAGNRVAEEIEGKRIPGVVGIPAGSAPENSTAALRALAPSHVVIVDAADMGEAPGTVRIIELNAVGGASFATHGLPLSVLAGYLSSEIGCKIVMIGIQPRSVQFGELLSAEVAEGIAMTVQALAEALERP